MQQKRFKSFSFLTSLNEALKPINIEIGMTEEVIRVGTDNTRELVPMFTAFEITDSEPVMLVKGSSSTDILQKLQELLGTRTMEKANIYER